MSDIINTSEKGRLRKLALSNRDGLSPVEREQYSAAILNKLMSLPQVQAAKLIMCYRSFRSEVDTAKIVENFLLSGKILCFPVCEKGGIMHSYCPNDEAAWKKSPMGIMEPDRDKSRLIAPEDIELVICPLVAFDDRKQRLGYGGGYYDRYLPKCKNALVLGIAFETQRLERIPTEEFDLSMDVIITERKIYK